MSIFTRGKKTKHKHKSMSPEKKAEKLLNKKYYETLTTDPDALRIAISKKIGYDLPPLNPLATKRKEVQSKFFDNAAALINADPELKERMTRSLAEQIMEVKMDDNGKHSEGFLDQLSEFEDTAGALGYKKDSNLAGLVVSALGALPEINVFLRQVMGQGQKGPPQIQRSFVIMKADGSVTEVGAEEYMKLLQSHEAKKLEAGIPSTMASHLQPPPVAEAPPSAKEPPKPAPMKEVKTMPEKAMESNTFSLPASEEVGEPAAAPPEPKEEKSVEKDTIGSGFVITARTELPEVPKGEHSLDLMSWDMERVPEEWVDELVMKSDEGDEQAKFLVAYLTNNTVAGLLASIAPFAQMPEYKGVVEKLNKNREWLERAITYIKQLGEI